MTKIEKVLAGTILLSLAWPAKAAPQLGGAEEEIVFIRHGEKPNAGLGQLDCRGLNRSLALPKAIIAAVGRPDAIWAANPSQQKDDRGVAYDYVRPLATIEPTAIALGLPVHTEFGLDHPDALVEAIDNPKYNGQRLLVVWEHKQIVEIIRTILVKYGRDASAVPKWPNDDYDSIYDVLITRTGSRQTAIFSKLKEGILNLSPRCP